MKEGSWVVCIDDSNWDPLAFEYMSTLPVKGRVYQVRRVIENFIGEGDPFGIALHGIFGHWDLFDSKWGYKVLEEYHFKVRRFREVDPPRKLVVSVEETLLETCEN